MAYSLRISGADLDAHHARMSRVSVRVMVLSLLTLVVGQSAAFALMPAGQPSFFDLLSVGGLGLTGPLALVGLLVGGSMWRHARAARGAQGDLEIDIDAERRLSARRPPDAAPYVSAQPILGGQAFLDHVQLTVGTVPSLQQVELPVGPEVRDGLLRALGGSVRRVDRSFARNLVLTLCAVGPGVAVGLLAAKAIVVVAEGLLLVGLTSLPAQVGLPRLALGAALGATIPCVRLLRAWAS